MSESKNFSEIAENVKTANKLLRTWYLGTLSTDERVRISTDSYRAAARSLLDNRALQFIVQDPQMSLQLVIGNQLVPADEVYISKDDFLLGRDAKRLKFDAKDAAMFTAKEGLQPASAINIEDFSGHGIDLSIGNATTRLSMHTVGRIVVENGFFMPISEAELGVSIPDYVPSTSE